MSKLVISDSLDLIDCFMLCLDDELSVLKVTDLYSDIDRPLCDCAPPAPVSVSARSKDSDCLSPIARTGMVEIVLPR